MLKRFIADDYQSFANILRIALIYIDNNEMVSWSNPYDRDLQIISTRRANYLQLYYFYVIMMGVIMSIYMFYAAAVMLTKIYKDSKLTIGASISFFTLPIQTTPVGYDWSTHGCSGICI
jgi:hypothetical protein